MRRFSIYSSIAILFILVGFACSISEPFPSGPCNDDGETIGDGDTAGNIALVSTPPDVRSPTLPHQTPSQFEGVRPGVPKIKGWGNSPGFDGLVRMATPEENRRFNWPPNTLLMAKPVPFVDEITQTDQITISVPTWLADKLQWKLDKQGRVVFERLSMVKVQALALGYFVEHREIADDSEPLTIRRPIFTLFGAEDKPSGRRAQMLIESSHAMVLHTMEPHGGVMFSAPHTRRRLDLAAPDGYEIAAVSPSEGGITHDPLVPYDCENGSCEDPDDELDECEDGIDNDNDGHRDLCDWNCLPHADFNANAFPDAHSRVEHGKTFAMMGGGTICTDLQETWAVTFADWALNASELLSQVRPDVDHPIRYRVFSCWIFEDQDAVQLCQHGPFVPKEGPLEQDECPVTWLGPPICPPGLENYPYQPTDTEILLSESDSVEYCGDRNRHYFDELPRRGWRDFELNTAVLGPFGEPAHGVVYLTSDIAQLCMENQQCPPRAGVAFKPDAGIEFVGFLAVSDANPDDWRTLAHETGHVLGLEHDSAVGGFMNTAPSGGVLPTLETFNLEQWDEATQEKGWFPRSSGWYNTGCTGYDQCAPLGKPGWSCLNGQWCEKSE